MINKTTFNKISTHPLQTWEWGEFRKTWGNEVVRFPFGQITIHKIPLLPYKIGIFVKGPKPSKEQIESLKDFAKKNNIFFIKLEPNFVPKDKKQKTELIKLLQKEGCKKGRRLFTPQTFWIDLTKSEEELLKSFSPKTRYNIRLSERKGVKIKEDNSDKAFNKYLELTFQTAKRQGFYAHTKKYHQIMWKILRSSNIAHLLVASHK
ncbi:MAG: peptidoglycan bridge formation glycyltransferase FemA/FemB family protein, partial [Patescibacteria group bacterium]